MKALATLDNVRIVPSAAESFLVKSGCAIFKDMREKRTRNGQPSPHRRP